MRKHLFLTGMMGSGKSTMGKALAQHFQVDFVDLDDLIVKREGKSIPDIFEKQGEATFRVCETNALRAACEMRPCVVATGGGAVLKDENVSLMRETGVVVLMDRPLEAMIRNVNAQGRPNLAGGKEERMRTLYAQRTARYHAACDLAFDNSGTPQDALQRLIKESLIQNIFRQ